MFRKLRITLQSADKRIIIRRTLGAEGAMQLGN